jgi:hypothetical protein
MTREEQGMTTLAKQVIHRDFWRGEGPCLILIPTEQMALYHTDDYPARFANPLLMYQAEMERALRVVDWPTDGISTIRPNLGVVFIPAMAGLGYEIHPGQMPWPGKPLSKEEIRQISGVDTSTQRTMRLAAEFYAIHQGQAPNDDVIAYQPDTQGVFDIAHLLYGESILYDVTDDPAWVHELLEISLDLYHRGSRYVKKLLGEPVGEMFHGHGTPQGVWFPHAGVRISEDTATLLSPRMLEEFVLPYIERALGAFGGGFVHYCGRHNFFFKALCKSPFVRAIDLGNSEFYDLHWLFERCAESGTVLYSRVAAQAGEHWVQYVRRIAEATKSTGARCILRPEVYPSGRSECAAMLELWHELTMPTR